MSARKCQGCGAAVTLRENGDLVCFNGHSQPEAVGELVRAMAELVAGPLRDLRATIEEQGIGLESLREEVRTLRVEPTAAEYNDLATEAQRIGRSRDWLRDHARELGVASPAASGADGSSGRRLRTRGSPRSRMVGAHPRDGRRRRARYPRACRCWT